MLLFFKGLLIAGVLGFTLLAFFRRGNLMVQRLMGGIVAILLSVFVMVPSITTRIAAFFGIGRGADFLFYCAHLSALFLMAVLYRRVLDLQQQVTRLARTQALEESHSP